jgi:hypothetical protein
LPARIRDSPVAYTDDTGWQVGGESAHLIAFDADQAKQQKCLAHLQDSGHSVGVEKGPGSGAWRKPQDAVLVAPEWEVIACPKKSSRRKERLLLQLGRLQRRRQTKQERTQKPDQTRKGLLMR